MYNLCVFNVWLHKVPHLPWVNCITDVKETNLQAESKRGSES